MQFTLPKLIDALQLVSNHGGVIFVEILNWWIDIKFGGSGESSQLLSWRLKQIPIPQIKKVKAFQKWFV